MITNLATTRCLKQLPIRNSIRNLSSGLPNQSKPQHQQYQGKDSKGSGSATRQVAQPTFMVNPIELSKVELLLHPKYKERNEATISGTELSNQQSIGSHDQDIRDSIRGLCKQFPGSYWRELEKNSQYPTEFVKSLQDGGYLSLMIPEKYGGMGLGLREASIALEEIHRSGCNGGAAHAQMYMMGTLLKHGSEEQKDFYLPKIASGEIRFQSFGVTEPNSGTDTLSLKTLARKQKNPSTGKNEYIVTGQKIWTSRAKHSDLMLLLARTAVTKEEQKEIPRNKQLSAFLVDMKKAQDSGAMKIQQIDAMVNHSTCEVFMDEMVVPESSLVGNEGDGLKCILSSMNAERILIASECIGDARFFVDRASSYATNRAIFGKPIGANQAVQFPIAESYAATEAAALMVRAAIALFEGGRPCGAEANMAKYLASEASWKAGDACMQTYGGMSFAREMDIERKWREARLYRIAPISSNLILSFVGEKVLGMPKSY